MNLYTKVGRRREAKYKKKYCSSGRISDSSERISYLPGRISNSFERNTNSPGRIANSSGRTIYFFIWPLYAAVLKLPPPSPQKKL